MIVNDHNTLFNRDRYQALAAALDGRAGGTNAPASRGEPHISRLDTNTDDSRQQPNHGVGPGLRLLL